jgi:hypothetical protein
VGKFIDLTNQRFGRLLAMERNGTGNTGQANWKCLCDCGKVTNVLGDNLRRGLQVSCGCFHLEKITTHGATKGSKKSIEYKIWQEMRRRCADVHSESFQFYGARGITVCDRWLNSFENFFDDMGKRPSPRHSIDRIYNDDGYSPSNCRWATGTQQSINQRMRKTNKSGYKGVNWSEKRQLWESRITLNYKMIYLGGFKSIEEAAEARKKAEIRYHNRPS